MNKIPDKSVDLLTTDLPYGTTQNKWDIIIPFESLWSEIKRVLKDKAAAVFTAAQPFTSQLVLSNLDWFKYDLIWQKTLGSGQLNIKRRALRVHEEILVFYNKFGTYNEQMTEGKPYKITRKADDFGGNYGAQKEHTKINDGFRHARSIVKISNPRIKGGHPTQKPVELFEYVIKTYSNPGDLVLDCCMGAGTSGEACINLKRDFIGIDLEKEWFLHSADRLKNVQMKLFE